MSALVTKSQHMLVSSDTALGARRITSSEIEFDFKNLVQIPKRAKNISVGVVSATIPLTQNNVSTGVNDEIIITTGAGAVTLTLAAGNYSPTQLSVSLSRLLTNAGLSASGIAISGDGATSRIVIGVEAGFQVTFGAKSPYALLGMTNGQSIPAAGLAVAKYYEAAPNIATFSQLTSFLVNTDLVRKGIAYNNSSQIVSQIPIDAAPGGLEVYRPQNIQWIDVQHLSAMTIRKVYVRLTDQNGAAITFANAADVWLVEFEIRYEILEELDKLV